MAMATTWCFWAAPTLLPPGRASHRPRCDRAPAGSARLRPCAEASLAEVGFHSGMELMATYAGRALELEPTLAGVQINDDLNLRLQYLATRAELQIGAADLSRDSELPQVSRWSADRKRGAHECIARGIREVASDVLIEADGYWRRRF